MDETVNRISLDRRSKDLRRMIVEMLRDGRRGHLGASFSPVEILRVLYDDIMRFKADEPWWPLRDRFILSKGHGCLAQYVFLAEKGFFPKEELTRFCHLDGILGGHPERGKVPGVEASTGALGHGLSVGIGFALNARIDKTGARVFVVMGDGECNEGSVWEAAMCASKHGLDNLVAIVDYNKHQSYSSTREVQDLEPFAAKWEAFGFSVREVDGHDVSALRETFRALPFTAGKPNAVICHTVKGKGIPYAENNLEWHHKAKITDDQIAAMLQAIEEY